MSMMLRLKFERLRRGLSQEAVGRAARVDRADLSRIEAGIDQVAGARLRRIAAALELTPETALELVEVENGGNGNQ